MNSLVKEIKDVAESGILPDGDHVELSTQLWLEGLIELNCNNCLHLVCGLAEINPCRCEKGHNDIFTNDTYKLALSCNDFKWED